MRRFLEYCVYLACSALVACGDHGAESAVDDCGLSSRDVGSSEGLEGALHARIDDERSNGGCCGTLSCFEPTVGLTWNASLASAAADHARDMAERDYFDHFSPEGRSPLERALSHDYAGCVVGENLAEGQDFADLVIQAWMASEDHCANVLEPRFKDIGIRVEQGSFGRSIWVANFGG